MATTARRHIRGHAMVEVDAPAGWETSTDHFPTAGDPDLVLRCFAPATHVPPLLAVLVERSDIDLDGLSARAWSRLSQQHPSAVLTSSDVWPHPVWGDGRLVQTARVDGDITLAHDWYLFRHAGWVIRIEVECALADLLELEDAVADIVAHVRPKAV